MHRKNHRSMNTVSITVDIEDWYHKTFLQAKSFTKKTIIEKWTGKYDYLSLRKPTKRVLDMLDDFDVKATFFVVADVVEHFLSGIGGINR